MHSFPGDGEQISWVSRDSLYFSYLWIFLFPETVSALADLHMETGNVLGRLQHCVSDGLLLTRKFFLWVFVMKFLSSF